SSVEPAANRIRVPFDSSLVNPSAARPAAEHPTTLAAQIRRAIRSSHSPIQMQTRPPVTSLALAARTRRRRLVTELQSLQSLAASTTVIDRTAAATESAVR